MSFCPHPQGSGEAKGLDLGWCGGRQASDEKRPRFLERAGLEAPKPPKPVWRSLSLQGGMFE